MTKNIQDIKNSMLKNQNDQFFEITFYRSDERLDESLRFQKPFIDAGSKFKIFSHEKNQNNLTLRVVAISENGLHDAFTQWSNKIEYLHTYYEYVYATLISPRKQEFKDCYCDSVGNINNGIFEVTFRFSVNPKSSKL